MMMTSPRMTRRRMSSMDHNNNSNNLMRDEQEEMQRASLHRIELSSSSSDDAKSDDDEEDEDHLEHHAGHPQDLPDNDESKAVARGGVVTPFPWKLHDMLEDADEEGREHIVSWQAHGRSFMVHQPKDFVSQIMKKYFNQSKFASFQRQLNLYGFRRLTHGRDKGAYWHECFVRGQRSLCKGMIRQKIKGTKVRKTLAPHEEPDFYKQEWALSNKKQQQPATTTMAKATTTVLAKASPSTMVPASSSMDDGLLPAKAQTQLPPLVSPTVGPIASPLDFDRNIMDMTETATANEQPRMAVSNSDNSAAMVTTSSSMSSFEEMVEDPYTTTNTTTPCVHTTNFVLPETHNMGNMPDGGNHHHHTTTTNESSMSNNNFSMKNVKGGDLLFFEGRPFHYLEHLEGLPPPYPTSSVMSLAAAFCQAQPTSQTQPPPQMPQRQPPSPSGLVHSSLSRLDLDHLLSYNVCSV